ncbi:MAG: proton-conducting transporter membrane subunit [Nitrososphaerota archaeon]
MVMIVNPLNIILILIGAAFLIVILDPIFRRARLIEFGGVIASLAFTATLIILAIEAAAGAAARTVIFGPDSPLTASLKLDALSIYLSMIFSGLGLMASIYSIRYMLFDVEHLPLDDLLWIRRRELGFDRYYALLLTLIAGMIGVTMANDFFTLYVFWELMAISSYSLVAFRKWSWEAVEAGFKYLVMSTLGSLAALLGIALLYGLAGSLRFDAVKAAVFGGNIAATFSLAMIVIGFGVTAAIVPFHSWLPDAHPAAPTPISAVLSGIVIKTGVYAILWPMFRVFGPATYGFGPILIGLGILTMSFANIAALMQTDIKRFLAYSSIANIGYIVMGLGLAAHILKAHPSEIGPAALALAGALLHVLNHALGKGLSFLSAGCYIIRTGSREIGSLEGVGPRMPITTVSLGVGLLNLAGVPPLSGFWSKLLIISAGLGVPSDNLMLAATIIFILNSILAAGYYLWLLQRLAFKKPGSSGAHREIKEAPPLMLAPLIILAAACIMVTLMLNPILQFIQNILEVIM